MSEEIKFQKGKHFEEKIVQALIVDHQFAEQMLEVMNVEYFNVDYLKRMSEILFDYYEEYKAFPSYKTLVLIVKDKIQEDLLRGQMIQYLVKIKSDPLNGDGEYIKDESLDFCKKRSLAMALEDSLDCINDKKFDQIVPIIQKALVAGSERDIGHVFVDDDNFQKRMTNVVRKSIPMPWPEINELTQGGAAAGELWTILAPTGVGKSHTLVDIGHYAALQGYNVVHYTLELSDLAVGKRYDARYSSIPVDQLNSHKEKVRRSLDEIKGNLIIKQYPCKAASALTLKSHCHKLAMKDLKPDLILVDYGDLMRSRKNYDQKRFEEEAVYEDLRNLAGTLGVPVITATQTNRSGLEEELITLKHVAECFQKAMISDVFITMQRRKSDAVETPGNFFVAKNRLGPDGVKLDIMVNCSISKIRIAPSDEVDEGDADPKKRLRKRLKDMKENQKN